MRKITMMLCLLAIGLTAQAQSSTNKAKPPKGAERIIRNNIEAFSQALMAQNYDAVVDAYTSDGKIFPNNQKILSGQEAIRDYWTPQEGSGYRITYHKVTPSEIRIEGKTAYDYGYYEGKSIGKDGNETSWQGKYVIIWKRVARKEWKIYLDIWNRVP